MPPIGGALSAHCTRVEAMQGLMVKLLNVDSPSERALRVVAFFDQLAANNPELDSVIRAAAVIADCPAGMELPYRGVVIRYSPDGDTIGGPATTVSQHKIVELDPHEQGTVWLERDGASRELDEFIVERVALTVSAVIARKQPPGGADVASGFSDPALAQLLVNDRSSEAERSRAARLIGLQPSSSVQLIAVETTSAAPVKALSARLSAAWDRTVYFAPLSKQLGLIISVGSNPVDWSLAHGIGDRAASGPVVDVLDAPRSWAIARSAVRFAGAASPWPRQLDSEQLGALRLLVDLDPRAVTAHPDVARMEQISSAPHGAESIEILDYYLHSDSLRSAARAANFHHSSMQSRIGRIGQALQLDLRSAGGRQRAAVALLLWRLFREREI